MFWILQKNLMNEIAFDNLLNAIKFTNTPHQIVSVKPFIHEMVPDINPEGNVYVCGSTAIGKIAKIKGWTPGYFDENLDYELVIKNYKENCLNFEGVVTTIKEANKDLLKNKDNKFFTRPCLDNKSYNGQIMDWENFNSWKKQLISLEKNAENYATLKSDDKIIIAPILNVYTETRFFIVDGQIVTGSQYRAGSNIYYSENVLSFIQDFAQEMINIWQPNRAFVMDIADTDKGPKVIEINAINSSGFYNCNMMKYVEAINNMKFQNKLHYNK